MARESSYPKLCGRKTVMSPEIFCQVTRNADFCRNNNIQHSNIPITHSLGLFRLIKDKGRYVLLIYLACFISPRHKERDILHILISRLFRLIITSHLSQTSRGVLATGRKRKIFKFMRRECKLSFPFSIPHPIPPGTPGELARDG